jgi:uncharacterized OB-fold protein
MRRAPMPYSLAGVTSAEGPRMVTNIVDCDFDKLKWEQPVKVVFTPTEGGPATAVHAGLSPGGSGPSSLPAGDKERVR